MFDREKKKHEQPMTQKLSVLSKRQQTKLFKASLLKPTNLLVLVVGFIAGKFSGLLIPVGIVAYGVLCYLDLSSEEFVENILKPDKGFSDADLQDAIVPLPSGEKLPQQLHTAELQELRKNIFATQQRIEQLYEQVDHFSRELLGELSQTKELAERSDQFLRKAQMIRDYLASEDAEQIQQGVTALEEKIQHVEDHFSKWQYQQALDARNRHLKNLRDLQRIYDRLTSQVTNISISLDSLYSRMIKLKTTEYSPTGIENEQVAAQLQQMLQDIDQLDSAVNEHLSLSD